MVFLNYQETTVVLGGLQQRLVRGRHDRHRVPSLLALAFGWFAFRTRVTGVYLSIITQALTFALLLALLPQRTSASAATTA